LLFSLDYFTI